MAHEWNRAIAYLKEKLPLDSSPAMSLSREDSPVLRDMNNGLLTAYVIDEGNRLTCMQHRDLATAGIDQNNLHKAAISNLYSLAEKNLKMQPYGSIVATFMEGNFEASVLLLDTV